MWLHAHTDLWISVVDPVPKPILAADVRNDQYLHVSSLRLVYIPLYACMRVHAFDPQTLTRLANKAANQKIARLVAKEAKKAKKAAKEATRVRKLSPAGVEAARANKTTKEATRVCKLSPAEVEAARQRRVSPLRLAYIPLYACMRLTPKP